MPAAASKGAKRIARYRPTAFNQWLSQTFTGRISESTKKPELLVRSASIGIYSARQAFDTIMDSANARKITVLVLFGRKKFI